MQHQACDIKYCASKQKTNTTLKNRTMKAFSFVTTSFICVQQSFPTMDYHPLWWKIVETAKLTQWACHLKMGISREISIRQWQNHTFDIFILCANSTY